MKITKSYLKRIIKEEIDEGFFSSLMGKKEEKPMQLSLETVKNVIKTFSRRFQDLAQQIEEMQKTFGKEQIDKVMLVGNEIKFGNVPADLQNKNKVTMQQRGVGEVDISLKTPKSNQTFFKFDPSKEEDQKILKKLQHAATMAQNAIEESKRGNQMKITKSALKQIIKEEIEKITEISAGVNSAWNTGMEDRSTFTQDTRSDYAGKVLERDKKYVCPECEGEKYKEYYGQNLDMYGIANPMKCKLCNAKGTITGEEFVKARPNDGYTLK